MVKLYREFRLKDGRRVILRTPMWEDLDDLMELINSLVEEEALIVINRKVTREEEAEWLSEHLVNIEKGRAIVVTAEIGGKVIGNSEVTKLGGNQSHVGILGIIVAKEYRDLGIGMRMLETLIEESRKTGLKLLVLDMLSTNARARHVYEKVGFKEAGRVPKMVFTKEGYIDVIRMYLEL